MWIKDEEFIRGDVPMTKFPIRNAIISELKPMQGDNILDIGAGTGSISVEAATFGATVTAIDFSEEAVELIKINSDAHNVKLNIIKGMAPDALPDESFNKCFIGGSGGNLEEVFKYLESHLKTGGTLVASFITLKNLSVFKGLLGEYGYVKLETTLLQASIESKAGLMMGQNPVFIVKGVKE